MGATETVKYKVTRTGSRGDDPVRDAEDGSANCIRGPKEGRVSLRQTVLPGRFESVVSQSRR